MPTNEAEAKTGTPVSTTVEQAVTQRTGLIAALWSNAHVRTLGSYLAALALCMLVLGTVLDVRSETRMWPYYYRGDTMFYHLVTKSVIDHGWFLDVPLLGAPEALNLRDVPTSTTICTCSCCGYWRSTRRITRRCSTIFSC
jgi:hypothetical protein